MQVDMKGKVALVTGGARDIGRAVSLALAGSGASVAVNYNTSEDRANDLVKEIERSGGPDAWPQVPLQGWPATVGVNAAGQSPALSP